MYKNVCRSIGKSIVPASYVLTQTSIFLSIISIVYTIGYAYLNAISDIYILKGEIKLP